MPKANGYRDEALGGVGRKARVFLARRRGIKSTPYDRPRSSSSGSIASRFVTTCSRAVASTASYVFSSLFGRLRTPRIVGEQGEDKAQDSVEPSFMNNNYLEMPGKVQDFGEVEDILQQRMLSRDEADHISGFLRTQATEHISTVERLGGAIESGSALSLISEAQRWREELKKARLDTTTTPVQLAQAFMGGRPSSMTPFSSRGVDQQIGNIVTEARSLSRSRHLGYRNHRSPSSHMLIGTSIRALETSIHDEGWMSVGRLRRAQESVYQTTKPSLYSREIWPNIVSPPIQSSHTARKILATLEKVPPSRKGGRFGGEFNVNMEGVQEIENYEHKQYLAEIPRFSNKPDFESMEKNPVRMDTSNANGPSSGETNSNSITKGAHAVKDEIMGIPSLADGNLLLSQDNLKPFPIAATVSSFQGGMKPMFKDEPVSKESTPLLFSFPSSESNSSPTSLGPLRRGALKDRPITKENTPPFSAFPSSESNSNPMTSGLVVASVLPIMGDESVAKENTSPFFSSESNRRNSTSLGIFTAISTSGMSSVLAPSESNRNAASSEPCTSFISASETSNMLTSYSITRPTSKEEDLVKHTEDEKLSQTSILSTSLNGLDPIGLGSSLSESSFSFKVDCSISPFATVGIQAGVSTTHPFSLSGTSNSNPFSFSKFSSSPNVIGDPSIPNAINTSEKLGSSYEVAPLPACAPSLEMVNAGSKDFPSRDLTFNFASETSSLSTFSGPIGSSPLSGPSHGPTLFGGLPTGTTFQLGGGLATNASEKTSRKTVKPKRRK